LQFGLEKNVGKTFISVEDLKGNRRTKVGNTKNKISRDTTGNWSILSRFDDKRPNRSHLRGAPKTKMA